MTRLRSLFSKTFLVSATVLLMPFRAVFPAEAPKTIDACAEIDMQQPPKSPVAIRYGLTGGGEEPLALLWADAEAYTGNKFYRLETQQFAPNDRMTAVQSGSLDAGSVTLPALLSAVRVGIPIRAVASIVETNEKDNQGAFVVLEGSEITDVSQLAGRRVSIMGPNTISEYWVKSAARHSGLRSDSIIFVGLPLPANEQALRNGQIDVAWLARQFLAKAKSTGGVRILIRPIQTTKQPHPTTVAFFTKSFVEKHPQAYCAWRNDYQQALENWNRSRESLYPKLIAAKYVTSASAAAGPDGGRAPGGRLSLRDMDATIRDMIDSGFLLPGRSMKASDLIFPDWSLAQ